MHPRLFFTPDELARLRSQRAAARRALIWRNLRDSADWCLGRPLRREWIAPVEPDPIHENLYDRFYAMMHDMAVAEHLAFASACSERDDDRWFDAAAAWLGAICRVWSREAEGEPDQSKAYAVMRVLKGIAVGYDLLHDRLDEAARREARETLLRVGRAYHAWYLANPGLAAEGQEPHHGSVEAASFGIVALALLGEAPEAADWLHLMVRKHTNWLLPHALTPSGTHNQTTNFWVSITQYRAAFMDALRRVTGRDLFREFAGAMNSPVPLACAVGQGPPPGRYPRTNESWLFGPSYGQIDYAAPALVVLAREYRRPIYQHLASWDPALGSIQRTRYVSRRGDSMLFAWGGYAYAWYDESVPAAVEPGLPRSFRLWDPDKDPIFFVNEAYARAAYEPGALAVATVRGAVVAHAGERAVLCDMPWGWPPRPPVADLTVEDDGGRAVIRCAAGDGAGFTRQTLTLDRPRRLTVERETAEPQRWWCHGDPARDGDALRWPDGTMLRVTRGRIKTFDARGYHEQLVVGMGKLKLDDPEPTVYATFEVAPEDGTVRVEVSAAEAARDAVSV